MTLKAIMDIVRSDGSFWLIVFIILSSLIEISPIKINPISAIFGWLSKKMNKDIIDRLDQLESKLDNHIGESDEVSVRQRRATILAFGSAVISGRKPTKEEFDFMISECDKYEIYCQTNQIPNGVAKATIQEIRRIYAQCIHDNSFLQGGSN